MNIGFFVKKPLQNYLLWFVLKWREFRQDKRRQDDTTGVNTTGSKNSKRERRLNFRSAHHFLSLVMIVIAAIAIRMIMALTSAVVIMFVLVCFDMMPIKAHTMTRL